MPASNSPQSSCSDSSANSYASLWHHLNRPATAMMLWLWHKTAPMAVPICPLLPLGLHCSHGSSPAPCPCPVTPPEPSLSGSALGLWGQHPVQHAQYRPVAIASPAVSLRYSLQSSSSSPPSVSHCPAAIRHLKRTALLQQADL